MIKAIFFDIDGTLLSFQTHRISPGTIRAFEMLHRQGIRTFISSGRPKVLIPDMPVSFDGYITVNGGYCFLGDGSDDSSVVVNEPLDATDQQRWLDYVEEHDIVTMLFSRHEMFANRISEAAAKLRDQLEFKMPPLISTEEMRAKRAYQFIAMIPARQDAEVLELLPHSRLPRWHPVFSDLIPSCNSKAKGIEAITARLGLQRDELMAFGDGGNDVEMLEYVGTGVAMGNAADHVKAHADFVTTSVDDEGILHALTTLKVI